MSLLPKATRIKYFKALGFGEYNSSNILKMQKKYFSDPKEHDSKYGKKSDALLRHLYNVWKYTQDFSPEEFKCTCGRCTGYPTQMRVKELRNLQSIRTHFGKPMIITSGLRCEYQNSKVGGVKTSKHLKGCAADFYISGVTDTLEHRKNAIAWIKKLPNHGYTYGNGWNSLGQTVNYPSMGNALHTDVR